MNNFEVYIMPIGSERSIERMKRTLLNKVNKQVVIENEVQIPDNLYEDDMINVWGLIPGEQNTKKWEKFKENDVVIFVPSKYDLMVSKILTKVRSRKLAEYLWGTENGQTWELIFFVRILGIVEKSKKQFLKELGYSEKDVLQGNRRITSRFIKKYKTVEEFLDLNKENSIDEESFEDDISASSLEEIVPKKLSREERLKRLENLVEKALQDKSSKYIEVSGKRIKRKTILVEFVKERDEYKCKACGFTFQKRDGSYYVEVAHIKPLSEGGPDDPENMVALCANCHKKLDKGNEKVRREVIEALIKNGFKSKYR